MAAQPAPPGRFGLLLGHARLGQFGGGDEPPRVVDCAGSAPPIAGLACGGWACCYALSAGGEVYSLRGAAFRGAGGCEGPPAPARLELAADSRVALPRGERCVGLSVGWDGGVAALTNNGTLLSWRDGAGGDGPLALPRGPGVATPGRLVSVAAAPEAVLALAEDGRLWRWRPRQPAPPPPKEEGADLAEVAWPLGARVPHPRVRSLSVGRRHVSCVDSDGRAWSWGWGLYGQLGHGDTADRQEPTLVSALLQHGSCTAVACGGWHTAFICEQGQRAEAPSRKRQRMDAARTNRALTCGWGEAGQLGRCPEPSRAAFSLPGVVSALEGVPLSAVACGSRQTLFATEAGELWACGASGHLKGQAQSALDHEPVRIRVEELWERGPLTATRAGDGDGGQVSVDAATLSSGGWHACVMASWAAD